MKERQFLKFLIEKFPELKDYIMLIKWGSFYNEIVKILKEKLEETENSDIQDFKLLLDHKQSLIYFYFKTSWKEQRVSAFYYLLKNVLEWLYVWKLDEYAENKKILDWAYQEYVQNHNVKIDNTELFDNMMQNNQIIRFNTFSFLEDCWCSKLNHCIALWWRYWVWKTVWAQCIIKDAIISNKDICILYFWTSEVDKEAFLRRFMVMTSAQPINQIFNEIDILKWKKQEIEDIIRILNYDISSSINYLQSNLKPDKYYTLDTELSENKERIDFLEKDILEKRAKNTNDVVIKWYIDNKKSEIHSIQLKNKEKYKNLNSYLKQDSEYINIIEKIYISLKDELDKKINEWWKKISISLWTFEKIKDITLKAKKWYFDTIKLEEVANLFNDINKFLKILSWQYNSLLSKEDIKNELKSVYVNIQEWMEKEIKEKTDLLFEEYQKSLLFLQREYVEINDNLHLATIEKKIKSTRQKFPDHKILFIIDYHQKVDCWVNEIYRQSQILWEKVVDLCNDYHAFWIVFSQLNNMFDSKSKANQWTKWLSYRPEQSEFRWWEWLIINVWSAWIIFNRDTFPIQDDENLEDIDQNFPIYEIYLTKNRYWPDWYHKTKQFFILDKKKISYLAISKKWYKILNEKKDILFLDQLLKTVRETTQDQNIDISDIID